MIQSEEEFVTVFNRMVNADNNIELARFVQHLTKGLPSAMMLPRVMYDQVIAKLESQMRLAEQEYETNKTNPEAHAFAPLARIMLKSSTKRMNMLIRLLTVLKEFQEPMKQRFLELGGSFKQ